MTYSAPKIFANGQGALRAAPFSPQFVQTGALIACYPLTIRKENTMQAIQSSYRGFRLLWDLNWDRALYLCTVLFALAAGAFVGSL